MSLNTISPLPRPQRRSQGHPSDVSALAARRLAATLAATLAVSGCALATDTPPSVDVLDVHLVGIGLTEQELATTLCVTNPNANEMAFRRVTVALDLAGSPLAAGVSDQPVVLPPMSSTRVPFTVVTTVKNIGPQLLAILQSGSLDYRVHGSVSLQGAFGLTLPFSRSGHFDPLSGGLNLASAASETTPSRCSLAALTLSRR